MKMGLPSATATFAPFFIAIEKGYLAEEGLVLEPVTAAANVSIASLLTGELQFSGSSASAVSAALKGAELKVIYTAADRPLSEVWTNSPDVRALADLVDRPVGVQSRGDSTELALRIALTARGIDPTALTYLAVGVGGQRLAAIQAGCVAAATLLTTEVVELQAAIPTARRVADLRDEAQMVYGGVATHDRELREYRDRTRRFLRAVMKARDGGRTTAASIRPRPPPGNIHAAHQRGIARQHRQQLTAAYIAGPLPAASSSADAAPTQAGTGPRSRRPRCSRRRRTGCRR
jgi:ABC-type nitrate/sulfonate/bicarbonate transport system substrate-binding protein